MTWRFFLAIICGLLVSTLAHAQDEATIRQLKITDNLYVLLGGGGQGAHVGVSVGEDGILLIDSMRDVSHEKLLRAVRDISDKPIRFVINTHSHSDHTGGNAYLAEQGAAIIVHENMQYTDLPYSMSVSDGFSMTFNGETIEVRHLAAHTHNDLIVHFKDSDVLFLGDTFTNTWHPTAFTFGFASEIAVTDLALSLCSKDTTVVPGHGFPDNCEGLARSKERATAWYSRLTQLVRDGLTPDEMMDDPELNRLRHEFVAKRIPSTMPDERFRRFIDGTLAADFATQFPMSEEMLQAYRGDFVVDDGTKVTIVFDENRLIAKRKGQFFEEIIPLSPTEFHVRASIDLRYRFTINADGSVVGLTRLNDEDQLTAIKTSPVN